MKTLLMVGGTMGVGKTTACRALQRRLDGCVFLDGDWCWDIHPFTVNEENRAMALDNIVSLLGRFLQNPQLPTVIFCWVLHRDDIYAQILTRLFPGGPPPEIRVVRVSLLCSEGTLRERLGREIAAGLRTPDVLERSAARLPLYAGLDTEKLMTDGLTPEETAARLEALLERAERT
ncbi:MAG TPA: AAA family ATPase [Firmicutes bacterium]|nr:AAA family ATPase [Bacillota bacterium]